jgi:hypothetical protein
VSISLLGIILFSILSVSRGIVENGSLLVSAVLGFYCVWMNFSALSADPSQCNTVAERDSMFWLIVGLVWSGISVTYTGWTSSTQAGILVQSSDKNESYKALEDGEKTEDTKTNEEGEEEEDDAAYGDVSTLRLFFVVMGACAMYMAMLLTQWASTEDLNADTNLSVESMWVQLISEWATILLYIWVLVAPALFPDRDWS